MKLIIAIYLEQLHREVFDGIYIQNVRTSSLDMRLPVYHALCWLFPNWRHTLRDYFDKRYERYSGYNRKFNQ